MVCRRVGASFGPEGLQAGAVKWLNTQLGVGGREGVILCRAAQHICFRNCRSEKAEKTKWRITLQKRKRLKGTSY